MSMKGVFGLTSGRTDQDIVDEVLDTLDSLCPNEWDALIWKREDTWTKFMVYAPVEAKSAFMEDDLDLRHESPGQCRITMDDARNVWIEPSEQDYDSPYDEAVSVFSEWDQDKFSEDNIGALDEDSDSQSYPEHPFGSDNKSDSRAEQFKRRLNGSNSYKDTVESVVNRTEAVDPSPELDPGDKTDNSSSEETNLENGEAIMITAPSNDIMAIFGLTGKEIGESGSIPIFNSFKRIQRE